MVFLPKTFWGSKSKTLEFSIEKGQSLGTTARLLSERGLISSRYLFVIYAITAGHERDFKAGKYLISTGQSIGGLVNMFSVGSAGADDIVITIPEGSNVADISKILSKAELVTEKDFLDYATLSLEGYLFPDTYRFSRNGLPNRKLEVIQKLRGNFSDKTGDLLEGLTDSRKKEVVIVASILEKEVRKEQDMRLVAGIINKRIQLGMPLEIDATLAYGVCYKDIVAGKFCDTSLSNIVDNISSNSEYNTYKRKGLPPGPISNPGRQSIMAALNPQPSDYLYYLNAKDGTTIFSKTATEHINARKKYLGF